MNAMGYLESTKSKFSHALDSLVFRYQNTEGMSDNLKIKINYMLRCHIFSPMQKTVNLPWLDSPLTVLSVTPMEIFASKIVALLNRAAPRDLYDICNMIKFGLFGKAERNLLRKCVVFYSVIASESVSTEYTYGKLKKIKQRDIKSDLVPVLRSGKFFDLEPERKVVEEYLTESLELSSKERMFLENFKARNYCPDLLFDDPQIIARIMRHPMVAWKLSSQRTREKTTEDAR